MAWGRRAGFAASARHARRPLALADYVVNVDDCYSAEQTGLQPISNAGGVTGQASPPALPGGCAAPGWCVGTPFGVMVRGPDGQFSGRSRPGKSGRGRGIWGGQFPVQKSDPGRRWPGNPVGTVLAGRTGAWSKNAVWVTLHPKFLVLVGSAGKVRVSASSSWLELSDRLEHPIPMPFSLKIRGLVKASAFCRGCSKYQVLFWVSNLPVWLSGRHYRFHRDLASASMVVSVSRLQTSS